MTPSEKLMMVLILGDEAKGNLSNTKFADELGVIPGTVIRMIKSLESKGFIKVRYNTSNKQILGRHIIIIKLPE